MTDARRELPYSWPDVRGRLQARIGELLPALGILDRASGGLVTPRNPTRNDRNPGSFVIWTTGDGIGAWKDYATGEGGDVFDLIGYLMRLQGKMDVYWWALDWLGLGRHAVRTKAQADQDRERAIRERKAAEAREDAAQAAKARELFRWWLSLSKIEGTLAWRYLVEARGLPLDRLPAAPKSLRFCPARDHIDEATGEVTTWPCMVAAMTRGKVVQALHFTWLQPDGLGKAPVTPAKKMLGSSRNCAIRLTNGASGLTPTKAAAAGRRDPLMIGEGIETTGTAACARPDYRAWAAGSLTLMRGLEWPDCASAIVLLRDNDWKPAAMAEFARVEAHWREQARGRPVKVAASPKGSDFNDFVRGVG